MRFRTVTDERTIYWLLLAFFWIALSISNLRHDLARHNTGQAHFHIAVLAVWALILLLYLYTYFFSRLEFEPTALRLHTGFGSTWIPYDNIIAIRPVRSRKGKLRPHQIELEIARLDPNIYPHDYRRLTLSNAATFTRTLRDKVPQAEYESA